MSISQEQWKAALEFFKKNPKANKFSKKQLKGYPVKPIEPVISYDGIDMSDQKLMAQKRAEFREQQQQYIKAMEAYQIEKASFHSFYRFGEGLDTIYANTNRVLGKGAFGTVKEAVNSRGEIRAIKTVSRKKDQLTEDEEERFRVMEKIGYLRGKIVREVGDKGEKVHILSKLRKGKDLVKYLYKDGEARRERNAELTDESKLIMALLCTMELQALHNEKIIHRDIKPENFVFNQTDEEILMEPVDFDLARILETRNSAFESYANAGTPDYQAPEISKKGAGEIRVYSMESDKYALGIMFKNDLQLPENLYLDLITEETPREDLNKVILTISAMLSKTQSEKNNPLVTALLNQAEQFVKKSKYNQRIEEETVWIHPRKIKPVKTFFKKHQPTFDVEEMLQNAKKQIASGKIIKFSEQGNHLIQELVKKYQEQKKHGRIEPGLKSNYEKYKEIIQHNQKLLNRIVHEEEKRFQAKV